MKNKLTIKDLFYDIVGDVYFPKHLELYYINNLNLAIETLDEREQCLINKRYKENMTIKNCGKNIVNLAPYKNPCDGICMERARVLLSKAIRKLKHPTRLRIIGGNEENELMKAVYNY